MNYVLHGIAETRKIEGREGVLLQRVPESVRQRLRPGAQKEYLKTAGAEIRFAMEEGDSFTVTLANHIGNGKLKIFFGDYEYKYEHIITDQPTTIEVKLEDRFFDGKNLFPEKNFGRHLVRLMLDGNEMHLIDLNAPNARLPKENELPKLKHLAYGTSITQGYFASSHSLCYAYLTADALGADLTNFGCSGNAYCEPELGDYLADLDYDFATFELSVNMFNGGLTLEEYSDRISCFIKKIADKSKGRPIFCISFFPYYYDIGIRHPDRNPKGDPDMFRDALKDIVSSLNLPNFYFISGKELMPDFTGLCADLLHPSNKGMAEIANNLISFMKPKLKEYYK